VNRGNHALRAVQQLKQLLISPSHQRRLLQKLTPALQKARRAVDAEIAVVAAGAMIALTVAIVTKMDYRQ
jgi:hypothetical protein